MPPFDDFVAARLGALRSYAHLLAGDEAVAVGLVDEALIRTGLAWPRVTRDGNPEAYVRATIVALYLSGWRPRSPRNGGTPAPAEGIGAAAGGDRHAAAARNELAKHLRPALHRLPRRLRTVLVLRYVDGLPDAEVARLLGCSERQVRADAAEATARLAPAI